MLAEFWRAERFEARLENLAPIQRMRFAAECAARCVPAWLLWATERRTGEAIQLRVICEDLLKAISHGPPELTRLKSYIPLFERLMARNDAGYAGDGEQAALSVLHALECAVDGGTTRGALAAAEKSYAVAWIPVTRQKDKTVTQDVADRRERDSAQLKAELEFQLSHLKKLEQST